MAAFAWQVLHSLTVLAAASVGVAIALLSSGTRVAGLILFALSAYLLLTIGLFGMEAYCRCRIPALPFRTSSPGSVWLASWRSYRSRSRSTSTLAEA